MVRRNKHEITCLVHQNKDDEDDWDVRAAYKYTKKENKTQELKEIIILTE